MEVLRTLSVARPLPDEREAPLFAPGLAAEDTLQFYQLAAMVRRRLGLILLCALIGAGATYAGADLMRRYTAKAMVLVEPRPGAGSVLAGMAPPSDEQTIIETHIMTMTSNAFLNRIFLSLASDKDVDEAGLTFLKLERGLKVEQELHSRAIAVSFVAKNPKVAALVANRVVQSYVDQQRGLKRNSLERQRAEMQVRIAGLERQRDLLTATAAPIDAGADADLKRRLGEAKILDSALGRQMDLADRQQSSDAGVSVLSPAATPLLPSTGTPAILAIPAGVAFAILGVFAALVIERSDRSLRSERDVVSALGVPCFGMIPRVGRARLSRAPAKGWGRLRRDPYGDAIRCLLVEQITGATPPSKVTLVTSTARRDGKSTLAFGLAEGAARLGRKTLLVDLDWRGTNRRTTRKQEPGMLDLLASDRSGPAGGGLEVLPRPMSGFDRIGVGRIAGDPAALLTGRRLAEQVEAFKAAYDLVVIDGPCLHGSAEVPLLGTLADHVLVAVCWGRTRRDLARSALDRLLRLTSGRHGGAVVGAVVTRVVLRRHALYRFGDMGEALSRL